MYRSNGEFRPQVDDPTDGADTIAWIREQSWCDGTVGMYGPSYLGWVQWAAATHGVEGLRAIAPTISSTDAYLEPWYSPGGALSWQTAWMWSVQQGLQLARKAGRFESLTQLATLLADPEVHLAHLPLTDQPTVHDAAAWFREYLRHPSRDELWDGMSHLERVDEVAMPVLQVAGWFDPFLGSALRSFVRLRNEGSPALRMSIDWSSVRGITSTSKVCTSSGTSGCRPASTPRTSPALTCGSSTGTCGATPPPTAAHRCASL